MAFISGGVQNDLNSKYLLRHSASSSWSLAYLITSLSMQALVKASSSDQSSLLKCTRVFSLVMRIYYQQQGYVVSQQFRALHSWVYHI